MKRIVMIFLLSACFSVFADTSLEEVITKANQGNAVALQKNTV